MKKTKAVTLIEMLIVIAILALLHSMLLPSLSRARELAKRTTCAAHLRGIGQAMYLYAEVSPPGFFPSIAQVRDDGAMQVFGGTAIGISNPNHIDRILQPSTTGIPSPTVDMWALLRMQTTTPRQFICPSTTDVPDPAADTLAYYDFLGSKHLSYAYQYQHDADREIVGTTSEPNFPVMADANPYIKGEITMTVLNDRRSQFRGNSTNHTNREGQNVLFQDGHVFFETGPDVGLPGIVDPLVSAISRGLDNCYTWTVPNGTVDPGAAQPTVSFIDLGGLSDACLVP
ncbi:MAG: prepilin-type N-terminal cleavage/methylation domain-containing protein [Phycisphaerales bacterium]|nr:prepilin-type N-terminal cleavage/methylation domain-containing protein [Phycisphaerales bacterium]